MKYGLFLGCNIPFSRPDVEVSMRNIFLNTVWEVTMVLVVVTHPRSLTLLTLILSGISS